MGIKVKLDDAAPSASQEALAKAGESHQIRDTKGRVITLKKPGVLAQFRLVEALGVTAENRVYMSMVMPLIYVSEIDGEPVATVIRKSEVDALIQRLDEHGIEAVMKGLEEHFQAPDPDADKAAIKK